MLLNITQCPSQPFSSYSRQRNTQPQRLIMPGLKKPELCPWFFLSNWMQSISRTVMVNDTIDDL